MNFANPSACRMLTVFALVSPMAITGTARLLKDQATPSTAMAAGEAATLTESNRALSPKSQKAMSRAAELAALSTIPTPFEVVAAPVAVSAPVVTETPTETPAPVATDTPRFIVKSIFRQGGDPTNPEKKADAIAMINGKAYRTGDQPAEGWTISEIDCQARTVRITGPDGRTVDLQMPTSANKKH